MSPGAAVADRHVSKPLWCPLVRPEVQTPRPPPCLARRRHRTPHRRLGHPAGRNLTYQLGDGGPYKFLVRDRNAKLVAGFDDVCTDESIRIIKTPVQATDSQRRGVQRHMPRPLSRLGYSQPVWWVAACPGRGRPVVTDGVRLVEHGP